MRSELVTGTVHPSLRAYVKRYTGFREWTDAPIRRRELPFGGVAVILALEGRWDIAITEDVPLSSFRSFAGGIIDRPAVSQHAGYAHTLQFDVTPLGALTLLGVPGAEIAGQVVALDALLGRDGEELVDALVHLPSWTARFAHLDGWLRARVARARPVSPDVAWAWRRVVDSAGAVPVETLVGELGCSSRHLSRRFAHDVGMTPKRFARLIRFEHAAAALRDGDEELGRIAARAGYFDQAHFTRDVRAFAGVTPSALRATPVTSVQATG